MISTQNIPRNSPDTAKASIKYRLWFGRVRDEIDMDSWPVAVNATINSIPMLPGKVMHYMDCAMNSIKPNAASVGDIAPNGELTITANIDGLSKSLLAFLWGNNGEDMVVIWEHCTTKQKFIAGSPCSGLRFTFTKVGTDDNSTGVSLQWKGQCPDPFNYFDGEIPVEAPVAIVADATTFALSTKYAYQVGENTVATAITDITNVTDADVNRFIEIIGNGSAKQSTISSSAKFILKSGAPFIAADGARITFQIVKVGVASYAFYEVSRS